MAHNAEKTKCWIDSNSGIDFTADVAAVLGRASTDEGCLCADVTDVGCNDPGGKVNKWAKNKPIRLNVFGALTAEERKNGLFGLSVIQYDNLASAIAGAASASGGWSYVPPRGGANTADNPTNVDEPYRIADFDYYNHIATIPYRMGDFIRPSVFETKIIDVVRNDDAEIRIEDFPASLFGDDALSNLSNVYVYLLVKRVNTGTILGPYEPTGGLISLNQLTSSVNFSLTVSANDTYQMAIVATTWTQGDEYDSHYWIVLPGAYKAAVVNDQDYIVDSEYLDRDSSEDFSATWDGDWMTLFIDMRAENKNLGGTAQNIKFRLEVAKKSGNYYEPILPEGTPSGYSYDYIEFSMSDLDEDDWDELAFSKRYFIDSGTDSNVYIRLWYLYTSSGDSSPYVYWRYFDFSYSTGGSKGVPQQSVNNIPWAKIADIKNL